LCLRAGVLSMLAVFPAVVAGQKARSAVFARLMTWQPLIFE
jgi:hypothetical protein